ncbi:MAG: hypothetical protein JNJ83_03130 [Verrucomicrobiaceae bacterium]|nr:hypothetical protein [Verrucomicrobiaceae bacterium]
MKKILSLIVTSMLLTPAARAERNYIAWSQVNAEHSGSANQSYYPVATVVTPQGHTVVTGYQDNLVKDVWVTECYDAFTGTRRWSKTNSSSTGEARPASVTTDLVGNVYVGGYVDVTGQGSDYCLIKYDVNGAEAWKRTYNNSAKDGEDRIVAITTDGSTGVYVTGHSMGTSSEDFYTMKYDLAGTVLWEKRHATSYQDRPAAICVGENGNPVVAGRSRIATTLCYCAVTYDANNGTPSTPLHYDLNDIDEATDVRADYYGNTYVTGIVRDGVTADYMVVTVKFNSSGGQVWAKVFDPPGGNGTAPNYRPRLALEQEGDLYMACTAKLDGFKTVCSLTRYTPAGGVVFSKTNEPANVPTGTFITDLVQDLAMDHSGNLITVGGCYSTATGQDVLAVKFNRNDGAVMWEQRIRGASTSGADRGVAVAITPDDHVSIAAFLDRGDTNNYDQMAVIRLNNLTLSKGDAVYGGGVKPGATINSLGTPCLRDGGTIITKATVKSGSSVLNALVTTTGGNQVIALQGQAVPNIAGAKFATFSDPVANGYSYFGSVVTLTGTPSDQSTGLLTNIDGSLQVLLQTGKQVPGLPAGTQASKIVNVAPNLGAHDILLTLKGAGITSANNQALVRLTSTGGLWNCTSIFRTGETVTVNGKASNVTGISMFSPPTAATGHSRYSGFYSRTTFIATLADGRKVVVMVKAGTRYFNAVTTGDGIIAGTKWKSLTSPGVTAKGTNTVAKFIFSGMLQTGIGGVSSGNDGVLVVSENGYNGFGVLAREGDAASGINGAKFATLSAPVSSDIGYAFKATLTGSGINSGNNTGIWRASAAGNASFLARTGGIAPNALGGSSSALFNSFSNIAWAGAEAGPTIRASLRGSGITSANNQALYAFDSKGVMREVLRTGAQWGTLKVKSFTVLNSVAKGMCSSRSFNEEGFITALVTFTNLSQSVVKIAMP